MKKIKLQRPEPLEIERDNGVTFVVQPATRDRVRAALSLDGEDDARETSEDVIARVALQVEALVGPDVTLVERGSSRVVPSGPVLGSLTPAENLQILWALWGQATGYSPAASVAALKKKLFVALLRAALAENASSASTPKPPGSPTISAAA